MRDRENTRKIPELHRMVKLRDTKFLKSYTLDYTNAEGRPKSYEMVSNFDYDSPAEIGERPSGVILVGFRGEELLLLREFRMGVNRFLYNLPAGHIDEGESVEMCARRELAEETGLAIKAIYDILPPAYAAPDLSDSSAWVVFAEVCGDFAPHTEADEYILPFFVGREQAGELLKEGRFSARAQLIAWFFAREGREGFCVSRKGNKNVVVISEAEYNDLQKAKRNAEYLAHLDRSFEQLKRGDVVVKTMEELERMADE